MTIVHGVAWDAAAQKFITTEAPMPVPEGLDLLVEVAAVSLNPVDLKVKAGVEPGIPGQLGFDACGRVMAMGPRVSEFEVGDRVYYAGSVARPGSNASHQLVDARIVAKAPTTLDDAAAAALPLTAITAWEALFERLRFSPLSISSQPEKLLLINGAGGVGSMTLQLARLSGISVTATASRPESQEWCRSLGADEVISHGELGEMPDNSFDRIFCCHDTATYFGEMGRLIAPQGIVCSIVGTPQPQSLLPFFRKSASFVWEYMFTRPVFQTNDIARQGEILAQVARLVDEGKLQSTSNDVMTGLNPDTLTKAHATISDGKQIGKLVIAL